MQKPVDANRLSAFLNDCLATGCLRGFQHFELYLRGKEELICRVEVSLNHRGADGKPLTPWAGSLANSKLYLSNRSQYLLYEKGKIAPASPCDRELEKDNKKAAFLIAGYARYKHPYVWLRSNHQRLASKFKLEHQSSDRDSPLKLNVTSDYPSKDISCVEVIEEIIKVSMGSSVPINPFAVDHDYFNTLSLSESAVLSAAMIEFLLKVYDQKPAYTAEVLDDILALQRRHFMELFTLVRQGKVFS